MSDKKVDELKARIKELEEGYALLLSKFRALEKLLCKQPTYLGEIDYHFYQPKDASEEIDF